MEEVIEYQKKTLGLEDKDTLCTKKLLAQNYRSQGKYHDAERIYLDVLEIEEKILGREDLGTLNTMNNLVCVYLTQGKHQEAEQMCLDVLELRERILGREHPNTLNTKNNLAEIYRIRGAFQDSERILREILQTKESDLESIQPLATVIQMNLAVSLSEQGKYQNAEHIFREVLQAQQQMLGPLHSHIINTKCNLAALYIRQRAYCEAEPIYLEALEAHERLYGSDHPQTEWINANFIYNLLLNNKLLFATSQIRKISFIPWHVNLSNRSESLIHMMEALLLPFIRTCRASKTMPALDALDKLISLRIAHDLAASIAFVDPPNNEDLKAALLMQMTMIIKSRPTNSFDPLAGCVADKLDSIEISKRMEMLSIELRIAVEKLRGSAPALAGVFFPKWLDENEVREVLRPGEVALYLCSDEKGGFGVLVSADEVRLEPLIFPNGSPVTTEKLEEMLEVLRDEVTIRKADDRQLRSELYRAIFSPVLDLIRGKDLVIIPTGPFRVVPYSLLCDVTGTIYLSNLCRYSLTPSLNALGIIRKAEELENPFRDRLLAVAHPVYTLDEALKLGMDTERSRCAPPARSTFRKNTVEEEIPLPGTAKEVDQIRAFFLPHPDTAVLMQAAATKRHLLGSPWEEYGHFHFACHSRAVDEEQGEAALVLSRYDKDQAKLGVSDSLVTYSDIINRKIPKAVVVLSACDTARGKRMGADLFSLARAFQGAGARAVLATLWRIPDEETPEFVEALYRRYRSEGKSLREALMETQEEFRCQGKPSYVWAPWVLLGE